MIDDTLQILFTMMHQIIKLLLNCHNKMHKIKWNNYILKMFLYIVFEFWTITL